MPRRSRFGHAETFTVKGVPVAGPRKEKNGVGTSPMPETLPKEKQAEVVADAVMTPKPDEDQKSSERPKRRKR